ncbi:DEAD/DEAH box helicase [Streptomonospora algeriensis]|uniref:DEAD/DEAH box helicase n=1 Tax=Streptomonospora algeriensis TaxID=995084 RepID=A0ABW3BAV6_9ACTN
MPAYAPRPYQLDAQQALLDGWKSGHRNRLAVVLPTGAGKTVVFSHLIRQKRTRTLVIAHREELITQAADKIREVAPDLTVGIVKAERDEHQGADVIVASIQTLAVKRRREAITDIGMVIVDECHHAAARTYMTVLEHFGAWRGLPVAGFTATMVRQDGGLADVWQDVVYVRDIVEMIGDGYLCDVRGKKVVVDGLDLDAVKTRNGDLQEGQLGEALDESGAAGVVADAYRDYASDRPGVVFTPTVASAQSMAVVLNATGITAEAVWGDMGREERSAALKRYEVGDTQVLTNCMVLTEGFDAPQTSCAVIARPTKSPGLYVQMAGRALRPHPGKTDALLLDVMGASTRHKLASIVDLTGQTVGEPKDGQSLAEAIEEEKRTQELADIEWQEVNLFGQSPVTWLRTPDGTWFVDLKDQAFLYLIRGEEPGTYRVRMWTPAGGSRAPDPDGEADLAAAMRWTESQARRLAPGQFLARGAKWRTGAPTKRQRGMCRHLGIPIPKNSTAGDVSDQLAIRRVSDALDVTTKKEVAA